MFAKLSLEIGAKFANHRCTDCICIQNMQPNKITKPVFELSSDYWIELQRLFLYLI